jgi:hypothetical protein
LPARVEPPPPARALTPEPSDEALGEARSSASPSSRAQKPGIPTLVKVVGGALVILIGVYLLSRQRDDAMMETQPSGEPGVAASAVAAPASPEVRAEPLAEPSAAPAPAAELSPAPAAAPAPEVSVKLPAKPVVVAPQVSPPAKPKVAMPAAPVPASVAAPAAPKPAAPPPVDNPY